MKWLTPLLIYLAVGVGIFWIHHAFWALLGFHVAILLSVLLVRSSVPVNILLQSKDVRWVILSIVLCGSSGISLYFLWPYFGIIDDLHSIIESFGLSNSTWPIFIAYFVLVNPWCEEYFWRGYLGSPTRHLYPSDFLYAGFHSIILLGKMQVGAILYILVLLVLAGWLWRQFARANEGLLASVLGHMAADLSILMAIYVRSV
jgi:hypothetical protein